MKISLRTKTTLGIILFALVLSTMSVYFSYRTYRESMDEHYYEMGRNVAETAASQLDPEVLSSFFVPEISEAEAAELMQTESYQKCRQFLIDVGDTNDVIFLYVVRPLEDGAYYLLDTDQSENTCQLGYFEKYYDGAFADNKDKFLKGEDVAPIISNEDFGWLLSAFIRLNWTEKW